MNKHNSFTEIYNNHKSLVYSVALHYVQNIEDAEEISQDVFIKVYQSIHDFKEESNIKTWIYRIAINQSLDFLKKKNSKKRFFIFGKKSQNENEILNISNFEHPGIILENKEKAQILFNIINTLPENLKTAFILSKIEGLSNPEISKIMELSISAVESLIFRAKKELKNKLSKKYDDLYKNK